MTKVLPDCFECVFRKYCRRNKHACPVVLIIDKQHKLEKLLEEVGL